MDTDIVLIGILLIGIVLISGCTIKEKPSENVSTPIPASTPTQSPPEEKNPETVYLWENGTRRFVADENSFLGNFLLKTLHRIDIQTKCVYSEERIQRMKKKDRIVEMSFRFPENITISQWIRPNHRNLFPTNESGYRILENVSDALFILEDNLNEGLKGFIFVGHEAKVEIDGMKSYACMAISAEGGEEIDKTWIDEINAFLARVPMDSNNISGTGIERLE